MEIGELRRKAQVVRLTYWIFNKSKAATVRWESLAYLNALGNHNFIFSMIHNKSLLSTVLKTKTTLWSKVSSGWR